MLLRLGKDLAQSAPDQLVFLLLLLEHGCLLELGSSVYLEAEVHLRVDVATLDGVIDREHGTSSHLEGPASVCEDGVKHRGCQREVL